jgi:ABC-2 type transport system ATP-binding protein
MSRAGDAAIETAGLCKSFGGKQALRDIGLLVPRGRLLGLVGPNGAGKSTLLRAWVGLLRRDSGQVRVLGLDPATDSLAIRRRCCYLPGETSIYHNMTGRQFLDFALGFYPVRQRELQHRLLDAFALPLRARVRTYSAGMKQKLALLATLVPDVELYLLDEPDRALDASVRFLLRELLRELKHAGKTIAFSSHHLSEVESVADGMHFLVGGRLVPETELAEARAALRKRLRLRLQPGTALPDGAREIEVEPDGTRVLEVDGEPLGWVSQLPAARVLSAEVGMVHLEDLYQLLTDGAPAGPGGRS